MYTYIIIDDEKLIREGTLKKLSDYPDTISCLGQAENGIDGIELVEQVHPDIVILDMQMPKMDGTSLLSYLSLHYPDMPLIIISGYKDFDYMKHAISAKAIDYILKPFDRITLHKAMSEAINKIINNNSYRTLLSNEAKTESTYYEYDVQLLENIILGYHTSVPTISSKKLDFINSAYNLFLLTLYASTINITKLLNEYIVENNLENIAVYIPNSTNDQIGYFTLFLPQTEVPNKKLFAIQIGRSILEYLNKSNAGINIGVSNIYYSLSDLHKAYLETIDALNSQELSTETSLHYIHNKHIKQIFIIWEKQDEFLFRVEAGMVKEVEVLTQELFSYYKTKPGCKLSDMKFHLYQLYTQCCSILSEYLEQSNSVSQSSSIQNIITHIFSFEELMSYSLQFFLNISSLIEPKSIYSSSDVIEKVKVYIEKNYYKNITQDFISCLFYLNRSYLSTLFKKTTGQKFIDYLNTIRIKKAKEQLLATDKKMYLIAKSVGYDNTKYFFRIFKKFEGMTPEQYRLTQ